MKYCLKIALCFFAVVGMTNLQAADPVVGSQWAKSTFEAYEQGQFSDFFSTMDARYAEGVKNNEWEELRSEIEKACAQTTTECKKESDELFENAKNYREELISLRNKRDQLLQLVAQRYPTEFVSKIINDLSPYRPHLEYDEGDIDSTFTERYFKMTVFQTLVSLDTLVDGDVEAKFPKESFKLFYALRLRDQQQSFDEAIGEEAKQKVLDKRSVYLARIAYQYNERYLNTLAKGGEAENEAEKAVAEIMNDFQAEKVKLLKKHCLIRS